MQNMWQKLPHIRNRLYGRERNHLKTPEQVTRVLYLHVISFKMHERDTATGKQLDTLLQMTVEHVLMQRFKQSTAWTAK